MDTSISKRMSIHITTEMNIGKKVRWHGRDNEHGHDDGLKHKYGFDSRDEHEDVQEDDDENADDHQDGSVLAEDGDDH